MRNFIFGGFVTILALVIVGVGAALMGYVPTHANATPPRLEEQLAMSALDASMQRHAPRLSNPVSPTDENLIEGMKIYTMNCSGCHGGLDRQPVELGRSFYPPAPNLILDPLDDPEWHIFYAVRTGVRYTGMPSWEKNLSTADIWKVTAFLARVGKLPPAVQDYMKKATGAPAPAPAPTESEHKGHKARSSK
jgi:mono/diheme cytochrome c family protein